jgi:molybdate transport system substrate-binding protein
MTGKTWLLWIAVAAAWPTLTVADSGGGASAQPVTVFGAASLSDALSDIGHAYRADVRFSFAASSTLARQIEAGAPAGIFASASVSWMDYLQDRTLIDASSRVSPIGNSLVLIVPGDSPHTTISLDQPQALNHILGAAGRLAMADPAHVPAGLYARQALQTTGLWPAVETRTAFANDVRGVLALVERGEVPVGIVYATDAAISDRVVVGATFAATAHDPIRYSFALVAAAHNDGAAALLAFMNEPIALDIFRRHGFLTP